MVLSEVALFTDDAESTAAFYGQVFDADPVARREGIAVFHVGGVEVLIHVRVASGPGEPPNEDHFSFAVADVDESFDRLSDQGLDVIRDPADYDWGRSAYLRDPDGRLVELAEQ